MKQFTLFVVLIQIAHNKFEGSMNKERICPVMIGKETQIRLVNKLENIHHVVVQSSALVGSNVFALQLLHKQSDVIVYQTPNDSGTVTFDENHPILFLKGPNSAGTAGGHTQTWVQSGEDNKWFVGTKPKRHGNTYWTTQIARVAVSGYQTQTFTNNTDLPRLSYLNRAGSGYGSVAYHGKDLVRVEAAVSPNGQYFLIASIDNSHMGHFAIYNLNEVNEKLDAAEETSEDVNIQELTCLGAFNVPHFNDQKILSIQGYAIDDNKDIYISSQPSPHTTFLGFPKQGKPREIVKIPWGISNADKWSVVNLDNSLKLDALDFCTEFEGIQVTSDCLYLTVAYHQRNSDLTTLMNRIYQVEKF